MIRHQTTMQDSLSQLWSSRIAKYDGKVEGVKVDVLEFYSDTLGDVFLDWIYNLNCFFKCHNMSDLMKICFVETMLRGKTCVCWDKEWEKIIMVVDDRYNYGKR